jgi:hypothetical protein
MRRLHTLPFIVATVFPSTLIAQTPAELLAGQPPMYSQIRSPVPGDNAIIREYRRGPMKGRVEIIRDGRPVRTWKGADELERELTSAMWIARQPISVEDMARMNIADYNAESQRMAAESQKLLAEAVARIAERENAVAKVRTQPRSYSAPYTDGFTKDNTIIIRKASSGDNTEQALRQSVEQTIALLRKNDIHSPSPRSPNVPLPDQSDGFDLAADYLLYSQVQQKKAKVGEREPELSHASGD